MLRRGLIALAVLALVANEAFAHAIGKQLRDMPLSPYRVRAAWI